MLEVGKIRKGMPLLIDDELYIVVDTNKHSTGRGDGIIRSKMKSIKTGYMREFKFKSSEKVEDVVLEMKHVQYLYRDDNLFYFMDIETFEQYSLEKDFVGDSIFFLQENMELDLQFHEDKAVAIQLPNSVVLEVVDTAPNYKGDTASGSTKPATCDSGLKVNLPFFVENGQKIRVDTRTGEYIERA